MFWFKNAMIYRLTKELDWSSEKLQQDLQQCQFHPCQPADMHKVGWIAPLKGSGLLHFSVGKQILLVVHKEEKMLPSQVVKQTLDERIAQIEQAENRKLKKIEKQALKDDIISVLLPRAFSRNQHTAIWVDTETNLIYVDSASSKRAEDALALLRKSLGSLPVVPLSFANEPMLVMTNWLLKEDVPEWVALLQEAELKAVDDKGIIRCKQQDLSSDEILSHLKSGKMVSKLALEWEDHLSFVLYDDGSLKRLKFADAIREKNDDILKEDYAQRFDADFVLMTGELAKLSAHLIANFGGEKPRS